MGRQLRRRARPAPKCDAVRLGAAGGGLEGFFGCSHDAGCKVTYMAGAVPEAIPPAKAGADIIIAQGTEGGGDVGWFLWSSTPSRRFRCWPLADLPTGGLVAALALGAPGPTPWNAFSRNRCTPTSSRRLSTARPGAMTRSRRNRFIERWAGREWAIRQARAEAIAKLRAARESGDAMKGLYQSGKMRYSFMTSRRRGRSLCELQRRLKRF
jgi:hypothetical protein